jgi:AcrR family transcriptional regulator
MGYALPVETSTREEILLAAERLFADRGFGVSLREIGTAAGQRNHSAVQYHFGTRDQLITELFEYRMAPLNRRRMSLIGELRSAGRDRDLPALAGAYIRPLAEHVIAHRGASWYLRFAVRLALSGLQPGLPFGDRPPEGIDILAGLITAARPGLPAGRLVTMNLHILVMLASLEQRCEDPRFTDGRAQDVAADLIATTVAVLTAQA